MVPNITAFSIGRVQIVIDPLTDFPVFHLIANFRPTISTNLFIVCQDIECDMSKVIYIDYGIRFGIDKVRLLDLFVDDEGTTIAIFNSIYVPTNDTINAVIRMTQTNEPEVDKLTFVNPIFNI